MEKDKCTLCKKFTLGILTKWTLLLNIGFKCKTCGANYVPKEHIFNKSRLFGLNFLISMVELFVTIVWFPILALIVYFFMKSLIIVLYLSIILFISAIIFIKYRPYKLDEFNSMNERIQRVENAKKNTIK